MKILNLTTPSSMYYIKIHRNQKDMDKFIDIIEASIVKSCCKEEEIFYKTLVTLALHTAYLTKSEVLVKKVMEIDNEDMLNKFMTALYVINNLDEISKQNSKFWENTEIDMEFYLKLIRKVRSISSLMLFLENENVIFGNYYDYMESILNEKILENSVHNLLLKKNVFFGIIDGYLFFFPIFRKQHHLCLNIFDSYNLNNSYKEMLKDKNFIEMFLTLKRKFFGLQEVNKNEILISGMPIKTNKRLIRNYTYVDKKTNYKIIMSYGIMYFLYDIFNSKKNNTYKNKELIPLLFSLSYSLRNTESIIQYVEGKLRVTRGVKEENVYSNALELFIKERERFYSFNNLWEESTGFDFNKLKAISLDFPLPINGGTH